MSLTLIEIVAQYGAARANSAYAARDGEQRDSVRHAGEAGDALEEIRVGLVTLESERDAALSELATRRVGCVVAGEALRGVRELALGHGDAFLVTIVEHALRVERFEPPLWVCAVCGWTSSESEPCPEHGHTGEVWCCDTCRERVEQAAQAVTQ